METILSIQCWKRFQILCCHFYFNIFGLIWVNQCHTAALEARAREAATVDAIGIGHDLIQLFQFITTTLIAVYRGFSAFKNKLTVPLQITFTPQFCTLFGTSELAVIVFCTSAPQFGQTVFIGFKDLKRYITEPGVCKGCLLYTSDAADE